MDSYFKLPTGYSCLTRSGELIYAYTSDYRTRDTYELDNFKYTKISSSYSNVGYNVNTCLPSSMTHLIPQSISGDIFLSVVLCCCLLTFGLFKVFKR